MRSPFSRVFACVGLATLATIAVRAHASWPPPPGADMRDPANWPNDYHERWNYLSYFPKHNANAAPLLDADQKLGAAGMSIDKAWTYTIGRDDVRIFVIDSGIKWDEKDLVNKAALNLAELAKSKPTDKDGKACGGAGALAGYDCNGDGVFNVADYRDDPRIAPVVPGEPCYSDVEKKTPGGDRIKGDVNRNCILDPGDLIQLFSDGVDDDGNGYTDDICGWDFYKNDNDPYDDTRYGHGTGEAKDSNAEANNGDGDPGVCPLCRFVPLRVGDSFIADANAFGKAVVYAADNGAKVVQEALGTIDNSAFAQAAIDYAYGKGAIVMASMADENSFHHNMPATSNHTMTVHSIRYDEQQVEDSATFIAYDTCSNYGGHLSMSISATSCSSEATGRSSGMAGLAFSLGLDEKLDLNAEEVMQLFKMNADDIDVAESKGPQPIYYFSQPGYDQRFGYGRANAARMMQAIKDHKIPPEVDIVSPKWFRPIYAQSTSGSIAVEGRVVATRAKSYDMKVQWAPGVQPTEDQYRDLVAPLTNVPGTTVTGGTVPLAQLDPKQIDTHHDRDNDSPHGENDRSITIRVRAIAHYDSGDVPGEARKVVSIINDKNGGDPDLLPGFPVSLGSSMEGSPKLADIDGDGVRDIVVGDSGGRIHAISTKSGAPTEITGFPYVTKAIDGLNAELSSEPTVPSYLSAPAYKTGGDGNLLSLARETIIQAPAVADLDGDGHPEIVAASWDGTVYVVSSKGQDLPGWPKRLPLVPSCPLDPKKPAPDPCMDTTHRFARGSHAAPVVIDMNKDGKPEIVLTAFDGKVYVYKLDGSILDGFPVALDAHATVSSGVARSTTTATVVDLNGDGIPEIIVGSNQEVGGGGGTGPVFVIDGRGNAAPGGPYLPHWPIIMTSPHIFPVIAEGVNAAQAVADFDGDGQPEVVVQANVAKPLILKVDPGQQSGFDEPPNKLPIRHDPDTGEEERGLESMNTFGDKSKAFQPDVMLPLFSEPALGDLDQDGTPDLVTAGGSLTLLGALAGRGRRADNAQHLLAMWSGKTGKMLPGAPIVLEDFSFLASQAIADVSGDGYPEVIAATGGYFVHAADGCGNEAPGFPKFTHGWHTATAAVGDLDGDKKLEVVSGTRDGYLFAWHTQGTESGTIQWESFHHDNANTGNYAYPLDQGTTKGATTPLVCADATPPATDTFDAGGCTCDLVHARARDRRAPAGAIALAIALGLAAARRRRAA